MYDILFAADDDCCENLEVFLENDALTIQGSKEGKYEIQDFTVWNGRNVWKQDKQGTNALWFSKEFEVWVIGSSVGNLGLGRIFGPGSFKCPNEVGTQWTYSNQDLMVQDGGNDVSVKCRGK